MVVKFLKVTQPEIFSPDPLQNHKKINDCKGYMILFFWIYVLVVKEHHLKKNCEKSLVLDGQNKAAKMVIS